MATANAWAVTGSLPTRATFWLVMPLPAPMPKPARPTTRAAISAQISTPARLLRMVPSMLRGPRPEW